MVIGMAMRRNKRMDLEKGEVGRKEARGRTQR